MKKFFKRKLVRWILIGAAIIVLGSIAFGKSQPAPRETFTVKRADIQEFVKETGQVKQKNFASLRFRAPGVISSLLVDVGAKVKTGQLLARLDDSDLQKKLVQAQADLNSAEVTLLNSKQGLSDSDLKSEQALNILYVAAPSTFNDILNDSLKSYTSLITFYDSVGRLNSTISNVLSSAQLINNAENAKPAADGAMKIIATQLQNFPLSPSRDQVDGALFVIAKPLQTLQASLNILIETINAIPTGTISATNLETYKSALTTAKDNMNAALLSQITLAKNIKDAQVTNSLNGNDAQSTYRLNQAKLASAKATVEIARRNLNDAYLYAPISGVIAVKSKQVGESVATTDQIYYLLGEGGLEVTANVSEIDIAKVAVGNSTSITLDAYGPDVAFDAHVVTIDPAETVINGVSTYKVTFAFDVADERLRSGMTANIKIATQNRKNVLVVPLRAVSTKDGAKTVIVKVGEQEQSVAVRLGLKGEDGMVEVLEGLTEGDIVLVD